MPVLSYSRHYRRRLSARAAAAAAAVALAAAAALTGATAGVAGASEPLPIDSGNGYNKAVFTGPGWAFEVAIDGQVAVDPDTDHFYGVRAATRASKIVGVARVQIDYVRLGVRGQPTLGVLESGGPVNSGATLTTVRAWTGWHGLTPTLSPDPGELPPYCVYTAAVQVSARLTTGQLVNPPVRVVTGPITHPLSGTATTTPPGCRTS